MAVNESPAIEPARPAPFIPLLDYQREDVDSEARYRWNCWSRQTGKSFTKSLRRILRGLSRRRNQIFLSAGERQSRELMQKAREHCQALKIATDYYDNKCFRGLPSKQLEIALPHGIRIIGLPANPQTVRGFTGDVFLDEFAMHAFDREIRTPPGTIVRRAVHAPAQVRVTIRTYVFTTHCSCPSLLLALFSHCNG